MRLNKASAMKNKKTVTSNKVSNSDVVDQRISVANFKNLSAINLIQDTLTISEFLRYFETPEVKPYTLRFYENQTKDEQRKLKDGIGYSLATYGTYIKKKSYRNADNVIKVFGVSIDIDNENKFISKDEIHKAFGEYLYLLYTTHSSSVEVPRFRLVLFFDEPINAERYNDIFAYCNEKLGLTADLRARDVSRLSFYPSCPNDQVDNYWHKVNLGILFDTSIVPVIPITKTKKSKSKTEKVSATSECPEIKQVDVHKLRISKDLKALILDGDVGQVFYSKSEYVHYCVTNLMREDVDLYKIFSIFCANEKLRERYFSEQDIWNDIVRIADKEKKNRYGVVIGTEPFYPKQHYEKPTAICKKIHDLISSYIQNQKTECTEQLGIKASAGIGKTKVVIDNIIKLVNDDNAYIEVYLPSHKLAKSFKERINETKEGEVIKVQIIYGRTSEDVENPEEHCIKRTSANTLSKSGLTVPSLLCSNKDGTQLCYKFKECNYRKQYKNTKSVSIYVHQHLFLPRNFEEKKRKPDLIVIDESFWKVGLDSTKILVKHVERLEVPKEIKNALHSYKPYEYLANFDNPQQYVEEELLKLIAKQNALAGKLTPESLPDKANEISKDCRRFAKGIKLLQTMLSDYERMAEHKDPIFLYLQERKQSFNSTESEYIAWNCIEKRKEIIRTKWQTDDEELLLPTVYIDADLDQTIASKYFNNLRTKEFYAERHGEIWQLASTTNSIRVLKKEGSKSLIRAQKHINYFCKVFKYYNNPKKKNVLLITYKELLDDNWLKVPQNCTDIHFGGFRGIDLYKEYDACIVIGRLQVPIDAIERYGIGLWHDSEKLLILHKVFKPDIGYRIKNNKKLGIPVLFPVDERLQVLARQLRECETLQGIDRLRLLHSELKRPILILSNIPLDLDVDQIMFNSISELKINKILEKNDVISLIPAKLFQEYAKHFSSEDDAQQVVHRWKELYLNDEGIARVHNRSFKQTRYSFNPKGGRPPYCLHRAKLSKNEIISKLQEIHGPEAKIKLL